MNDKTVLHTLPAWTEVEYTAACKSPYLSAPFFVPKEAKCYLCREDGTRKEQRMIFLVFRPVEATDEGQPPLGLPDEAWNDDPTPGEVWVKPLDDEEVEPVRTLYIGEPIERFLTVESEDDNTITFDICWDYGKVAVEKAERTRRGFVCRKEDFGEEGLRMTLTPRKGEPFTLQLTIPYLGFSLFDPDGQKVYDDIEVPHDKVTDYTYSFVGNDSNDRFSLHLDDDKLMYKCVLRPNATLAVRDMRERLAVVDEIPSEGTLQQLMMNAHQALVKNRNLRWRITISGSSLVEAGTLQANPDSLVAFAQAQYDKSDDKDGLGQHLVTLEEKYAFQWCWLKEGDWSTADAGFNMFMKMLTAFSFVNQKPIQGDVLQARNNKRKIRRCARWMHAHQQGQISLWDMEEEARREVIWLFGTFHSQFLEALEEEK